ncbi:LysR substrate-binding domain-containing protein [Streptomyces sp. NPDC051940]|uniref:LysR substrate-binding domain-containing protein n=1 Tax=Streptomyces sp. NPDC051940 TaxID=3155675 RepID=UPI003434CC35
MSDPQHRPAAPTAPSAFRLGYVPGVTPGKWVRIWEERYPAAPLELVAVTTAEAPGALRERELDAAFVRLPVDRADLHAIPLYVETTVVVIPKDHLFAAADDELTAEDLADELVLHPLDDTLDWEHPPGRPALERPATTADAVQLVAAGVGVLVVPQSLARLHHRKDLTYRTVGGLPQSQVALSWREDATTDAVDDFIGVVRGRTVNSSRGRRGEAEPAARQADKGAARRKPPPPGRGAKAGGAGARKGAARGGKPAKRPRRHS